MSKKTVEIELTLAQLRHLRDLMGLQIPVKDSMVTISESLAASTNKVNAEASLWDLISDACVSNDIIVGDFAPTYVVVPSGPPQLAIVRLEDEISGTDLKDAVDKLEEKGTSIFSKERRK